MRAYSDNTPTGAVFLQEIARMDIDHINTTTVLIYADYLEDNGENGEGYRRFVDCVQVGAICYAWRCEPPWQIGLSPLSLAVRVASAGELMVADGGEVRFVCGPGAAEVVRKHPDVEKADPYPALSAAWLPPSYCTEESHQILSGGAFNTAVLLDQPLYVFQDLKTLISTLGDIPPTVLV